MKDLNFKITEGREYRNVQKLEARALDNETARETVEGYATVFDEPYTLWEEDDYVVREVVDKSAFNDTDMNDVIMQYNHEGRVFARTRNNTLDLAVDDNGLHIRADLSGTDIGRELYQEIAGGYTDKMSFGFTVRGDEVTEERAEGEMTIITRRITDIGKLYDVSAVSFPANDATSITARSFADGLIGKAKAERLKAEAIENKRLQLEERLKLLTGKD